jgi:hypothetical protein
MAKDPNDDIPFDFVPDAEKVDGSNYDPTNPEHVKIVHGDTSDPNHWSNQPWDPNEPSFFEMLAGPDDHEEIAEINANRARMNLPPLTDHPMWIAKHGIYTPPPPGATIHPFPRQAKRPPIDLGVMDVGLDDEPIPPRGWLLGNLFCRGFISSLLGDGATGKTAVRIACAVAMAADRGDIVGEKVFTRCRVLYLSFEDGIDELRRRIHAAMKYHRVTKKDVEGYLFRAAISRHDLKLATQKRNGEVEVGDLVRIIEENLESTGADVVIFDPLVKTHSVNENDNTAMDKVADIMSSMALRHEISVDTPQHTRKGAGEPGDADIGRGASATKDAGRLVYTLTRMNEETADKYSVPRDQRRAYIRHDSAKVNIAPPAANTKWFRLVDVAIANASPQYPNGDHVQTVEVWKGKDPLAGKIFELNALLNKIDAGYTDKYGVRYYTDHKRARDRAVWPVVQECFPQMTEGQCRDLIQEWLGKNMLQNKRHQYNGDDEFGLRVNNANRPGLKGNGGEI